MSGPVPVPGGQLLTIDYKCTAPALCRETPRLLTQHLEREKVGDADIRFAPWLSDDRFMTLRSLSPVARAYLRADVHPRAVWRFPDVPQAASLITAAAQWLRSHHGPETELLALVEGGTEVPLTWDSLKPVVENALAATIHVHLIVSDFATHAATATVGFVGNMGITLAAAGRDWRGEQLAEQMLVLRETARACAADVGWAGVKVYPATESGQDVLLGTYHRDELHVGLMWYQLISQAQIERLGAPPPGAAELPDGRFEVTVGEPGQWVPGHPDNSAVRDRAAQLFPAPPSSGPPRLRRRGFWRGV